MAPSPSPKIHSTLTISSGNLCFGSLHNIYPGASVPQVRGLPNVRYHAGGTVKVQSIEYNLPARNGTWNAFQLIETEWNKVVGWFLAHSDVDPEKEIDKILRVAGSPYEIDSGSSMNDDKTAAEGVFVVNRYDWGYHNRRSAEEVGESDEFADTGSLGFVDLAEAKTKVLQWKEHHPRERESSKGGAWLYLDAEYMFGRFGFDDEHTAARSFLFFSTDTDFTRTAFAGLEKTFRKAETPEETFERRLTEGFDFSGLQTIRGMCEGETRTKPPPPLAAECFGPYDPGEHILRLQDIDALRVHRHESQPHKNFLGINFTLIHLTEPIQEFADPWKETVLELINEIILSYLERSVLSRMGNQTQTVSVAAEVLFPKHTKAGELDAFLHRCFMQPHTEPINNFDATYVGGRIRAFLTSRAGNSTTIFDDECIAGLCRAIAFILTEALELANKNSRDWQHYKIVPWNVRLAVLCDDELRELLEFSKVYWEGRDRSLPLDETSSESREDHEALSSASGGLFARLLRWMGRGAAR
ncbi:hypothetical protein BCR34DRAFT_597614 [Clohesyomyces aquaticus]|uniref:Uncharacterized protein n=1 Tax=Clohesyomyces aquaticus TaxID=1231657 RepID=A0A1Y2A2S1_9PLEO|nr:hypothetical protein BCR34DRAFT_597614 [Clohesyomyces aquaticus]